MAKNKGKFGKAKTKVEEVDEFVGTFQRLGQKLQPHLVPIAVAAGALTVILISYYTYSWYQDRKERKATTALVKAFDIADRRVSETELPKNTDPNNQQVIYKTDKERSEAVLEALNKVNTGTKVGRNSQLIKASTLYDLGKYGEAASLYKKVASSSVARTLKRLAREGLGYSLEAQADKAKNASGYQGALDAFKSIQTDEKAAGFDVALFHEARLLAKMNKKPEAIAALQKLTKLKPPSIFNPDAERRLAVLAGNDKYPKPAPKKTITPEKVPDTPEDKTPENKDTKAPTKKSDAKKGDAKK